MAGINSVQPRVQGGLLDSVLKGVAIARDIYGIRADDAKTDLLNQQTEQGATNFENEQAGNYSPKELVALGKNYNFVPPETPQAMKIHGIGDDNEDPHDIYILPKSPLQKKVQPMAIQNAINPDTGEHGTALVDPANPQGPLLGFVNTAKEQPPPREQKLMAVPDVDDNGNPVTKIVPMVAGASYSTTPKGSAAADAKAAKEQDKTYTDMINKIETPRGNQNVQQAQSSLRAIANAKELISQYPNPNDMPSQQVSLLNQELAKVASGGVGSEHGQRSLEANTLMQSWEQFKSQVGNEPNGAQLGAFIAQNKQYLDGLQSVNSNVVNKYKTAIYNGFKNRLTDDQKAQFAAEYPDLFGAQGQKAASPTPQGGPGQAVAAPGGKPTTVNQNGHTYTLNPETGNYE